MASPPLKGGSRTACSCLWVALLAGLLSAPAGVQAFGTSDYQDALSKSILFYGAQRSGPLDPNTNRVSWRSSSGLADGQLASPAVDLTGGYYDAGDNVKFGLPMGFTVTLLSWSTIEYGGAMGGELDNARAAVRWGSDYILKTFKAPSLQYAQVGDIQADHNCWERPETMDTPRTVYQIDAAHPGSDLAGESAAALAAASIVFRGVDDSYADTLLSTARQLFTFADTYRGKYSDSIPEVRNFYNSWSGYNDELLWAAAWLHRASGDGFYLQYVVDHQVSLNAAGSATEFSWDSKTAGADILLARQMLSCGQTDPLYVHIREAAETYVCYYVNGQVQTTPDGMAYIRNSSPTQYSNNAAFLAMVYSDYLAAAGQSLTCYKNGGMQTFTPPQIVAWARTQVDYVLGSNNAGQSYMVGFGAKYPTRVHHRGASLPTSPQYSCGLGYTNGYNTPNPDPNTITGAIVGGPDQGGTFLNDRTQYAQSEPTTYINAGFVGAAARLVRGTPGSVTGCTAIVIGASAPASTAPSVTPPPATPPPVTPPPVTPPPSTSPPVTPSPVTPPPSTSPSVTPSPSTLPPVTPPPSTAPPVSSPPATPSPTVSSPTPANPSPTAPVSNTPAPTGFCPTVYPAGGTCSAGSGSPNQCYSDNGAFYTCCPGSCSGSPGSRPSCAGLPAACSNSSPTPGPTTASTGAPDVTPSPTAAATPAPTAAATSALTAAVTSAPTAAATPAPTSGSSGPCPTVQPAGGLCDPSSRIPNQCYSSNGGSFICCPGSCSSTPGNDPTCAPGYILAGCS